MRQSDQNAAEHYRYERKALVTALSYAQVVSMVKMHPATFREIHHQRTINNIYFDTATFSNYEENLNGDESRIKVRLRWYGELWGEMPEPVLEFKVKLGPVGRKERFEVPGFRLDRGFDMQLVTDAIARADLPAASLHVVRMQEAKMLNRYCRRYFESWCGRYRLTIDRDLCFYELRQRDNQLLHKVVEDDSVVVEVKYDSEDDDEAQEISARFPFALSKSSKYASGIDLLRTGQR